jgi:hypothetical protein
MYYLVVKWRMNLDEVEVVSLDSISIESNSNRILQIYIKLNPKAYH